MADSRSIEEISGGYISTHISALGAIDRELPTLKIRAARVWRTELLEAMASISATTLAVDLAAVREKGMAAVIALGPMSQLGTDRILDLIVSYDAGGVLGGRDWLEEHADDAELYALFRVILGVVFPFASDLRSGLGELMTLWRSATASNPALARSIAASFTSGSPATTDSIPPASKTPSTKTSS